MASERETMADVRVEDAIGPITEVEAPQEKNVQYVDVGRKMEVDEIFGFTIGTRKPEELEDWMYDFERNLRSREVRPAKWSSALKLKIDDHTVVPSCTLSSWEW